MLSLHLWGHEMANCCILFFTDNEALVHVINKQSCKDKASILLMRALVLGCLRNNILFRAKHVRGVHNTLADSLSRLQVETFPTLSTIPYGTWPNRHSFASAASELAPVISSLLSSSLQPSSLPTYQRAWKLFHLFLHATFPGVLTSFPISLPF